MVTLTDISENMWGTFLRTGENLRQSALRLLIFCVETGLPLNDYNKKFVNELIIYVRFYMSKVCAC